LGGVSNSSLHSDSTENSDLFNIDGEFVLAWSNRSLSTGLNQSIWRQLAGAVGRTQITVNGYYNGTSITYVDNVMAVYINGVSDASGIGGNIRSIDHPIGEWSDYMLIIRNGNKASAFYKNGGLVDSFTKPSSFPEIMCSLFGDVVSNDTVIKQQFGRIISLHRAPNDGEITLIRN
jgi:hypothetical protein